MVNKLRKHQDEDIGSVAQSLIDRWRETSRMEAAKCQPDLSPASSPSTNSPQRPALNNHASLRESAVSFVPQSSQSSSVSNRSKRSNSPSPSRPPVTVKREKLDSPPIKHERHESPAIKRYFLFRNKKSFRIALLIFSKNQNQEFQKKFQKNKNFFKKNFKKIFLKNFRKKIF